MNVGERHPLLFILCSSVDDLLICGLFIYVVFFSLSFLISDTIWIQVYIGSSFLNRLGDCGELGYDW